MTVIGTAGHVDHGKSTLVKALTGIDPDRLREEQQREMTIDLGFAWLVLPSGREVSLIDVPGHERFIKNMLAGVGGIDAVLLVIAADEAVMPQTREHLAIIDLLGITRGIVVLSKIDLVEPEWLTLAQEEALAALAGSALADAPIVPVSARTGVGLDGLLRALDALLAAIPPRSQSSGLPRLAIDRSFAVAGFGTVVTGTLRDGPLVIGQEVEILPAGLRGRIRNLQSHQRPIERAEPGMRVAVNLAGIHYRDLGRGDVLTVPGSLQPTTLLDAQVRVVADVPPLRHHAALDLFVGSSETPCRISLLATDELAAGAQGWAQLRLAKPVVVVPGDRFILRVPSPSRTVAGGVVVDAHPPRHRRFRADVTTALELRLRGSPAERLRQALRDDQPRRVDEALSLAGLTDRAALAELLTGGQVVLLGQDVVISASGWQQLQATLTTLLSSYHQRFPLRRGMPREELRQRLQLSPRVWAGVLRALQEAGAIAGDETTVRLVHFTPQPTAEQRRLLAQRLAAMARAPYNPPSLDLDSELIAWAVDQELLVNIAPDLYLLPETYADMVHWVRQTIETQGMVTAAQVRDHFGASRRYAVALLEHLDERRITRREGDRRVLA